MGTCVILSCIATHSLSTSNNAAEFFVVGSYMCRALHRSYTYGIFSAYVPVRSHRSRRERLRLLFLLGYQVAAACPPVESLVGQKLALAQGDENEEDYQRSFRHDLQKQHRLKCNTFYQIRCLWKKTDHNSYCCKKLNGYFQQLITSFKDYCSYILTN